MELPVYRLRYNTNPDQSMKDDDVLLFDLDSDPVRIIVGESKFRGIPDKQSVIDIVDGLVRSYKAGLPSLLCLWLKDCSKKTSLNLAEKFKTVPYCLPPINYILTMSDFS